MEQQNFDKKDQEIVFSKAIKAGKRIYYLDVKQSKNGELFLTITESKKRTFGTDEANMQVVYEKHKIFLYREDFDKFQEGLGEIIDFINRKNAELPPRPTRTTDSQESDNDYGISFEL